jgi:hypothetical protein
MFETAVWLVVTLYSPDAPRGQTVYSKEYAVAADVPERAIEDCYADAVPYSRKAVHLNRGEWMLDVACQVRHEEAQPAKGRE